MITSLKQKESETVEFKSSTSELKEALISIAAILNKHNEGELYFGIKNNGEAVRQSIGGKTIGDTSSCDSHVQSSMSSTYAKKELNALLEKNVIKRFGKGKNTHYRLVS